jgi:ATP-dependent protease ClpP protease subunit
MERDKFLSAEEACEFGLIDSIMTRHEDMKSANSD